MDLQEYLARMNSGEPVQGGGDMHRFMREINEVTMRLTCELNNKYHTGEEVREIFSKIIGKPVDKSFRLFPLLHQLRQKHHRGQGRLHQHRLPLPGPGRHHPGGRDVFGQQRGPDHHEPRL